MDERAQWHIDSPRGHSHWIRTGHQRVDQNDTLLSRKHVWRFLSIVDIFMFYILFYYVINSILSNLTYHSHPPLNAVRHCSTVLRLRLGGEQSGYLHRRPRPLATGLLCWHDTHAPSSHSQALTHPLSLSLLCALAQWEIDDGLQHDWNTYAIHTSGMATESVTYSIKHSNLNWQRKYNVNHGYIYTTC